MSSIFQGGMNSGQINKAVEDCLTLAVNNPGTNVGKYLVFKNRDDPRAKIIVLSFVDMMTEICELYSKCIEIDVKGASGRKEGVCHFCPSGCKVTVDGSSVKLSSYKIAEVDDLTAAMNPESIKTWSASNTSLLAGYFPIVTQTDNVLQDLKKAGLIIATKTDAAFSDNAVPIVNALNEALVARKAIMQAETTEVVENIKEIDKQELIVKGSNSTQVQKQIAAEKIETLEANTSASIALMIENTNTIKDDVENALVLFSGKAIDTARKSRLEIENLPKAEPARPNTIELEKVQSNDKSVSPVKFDAPEVKKKLDEVAQNMGNLELTKSNIIINSEIDKEAAIAQAVAKTPEEQKFSAKFAERVKRKLASMTQIAEKALEPDVSGSQDGGGLGDLVRDNLLEKLVAIKKHLRENRQTIDIQVRKSSSSRRKLSNRYSSGKSRSSSSGKSRGYF